MAATKEDLSRWFDRGLKDGKTHMVVVCDTFDWEDYPVFCDSEEEARAKVKSPGEMQKVMEVYHLPSDKEEQMSLRRCFKFSAEVSGGINPY